jgi:hypothetical protein
MALRKLNGSRTPMTQGACDSLPFISRSEMTTLLAHHSHHPPHALPLVNGSRSALMTLIHLRAAGSKDFSRWRNHRNLASILDVAPADLMAVTTYIDNQEEYRAFLNKYEVTYDEAYVWD